MAKIYRPSEDTDTPGAVLETHYAKFLKDPPGTLMARGSCRRADLPVQFVPEGQTLFEGTFPDGSVYLNGRVVPGEPVIVMATVENIKGVARKLIAMTDWYRDRASDDPTKPVPPEITARRNRIRERSNELEAELPFPMDRLGLEETWQ